MTSFRLRVLAQTLPFLLIAPAVALAQTPPSRHEANAAMHATANPGAAQFTRQQIDQMIAPIALYPDQLLSQVLMAASYPQQILDADQWLQDPQHKDLKGDALAQALESLPWEPSVKSLCAFPQIVAMMAEHIEWTQALGSAFASDQAQVMGRVQALRHVAMKSGKLKSVKHLKVREESGAVVITEEEPGRIYVPVYNPVVVYGNDWPDRDFAPVYLPPPRGFVAETIEPGLEVSVGYSVVTPLWGWSRPDWREHRITIERDRYARITRDVRVPANNVWVHTGPVVSVQNLPHRSTTTTTAQVPAGTVAPSAVARQAQPAQTGTTTPSNTASTPSRTNQPSSATAGQEKKPGQATSGASQPNSSETSQPSSTSASRPETTKPGQTSSGASQPSRTTSGTSKPSQATTGSNAPAQGSGTTAAPDKDQATTNRSGKGEAERGSSKHESERGTGKHETERGKHEATQNPAEHRPGTAGQPAGTVNEPAKSGTSAARPNASEPGASRHEERRQPGEREGATQAPGRANVPGATEERGREHAAPGSGTSQAPTATPQREHGDQSRPNAAQPPAPAAQQPQAERRGPQGEQAPKQAERPHQPPAQGSSTPPAAAPQHPQPQAGGHEKPRGDDEQKKEH